MNKYLNYWGLIFVIVKEEDLQIIKDNTVDFIGLNYYSPQYVLPYNGGETNVKVNNLGKNYKGDMRSVVKGWFEIDNDTMQKLPHNPWNMVNKPETMYDAVARNNYLNKPMYITENGLGMYEDIHGDLNDDERIEYIKENVRALLKAKKDGSDINGYFVWSPFDLYSWKNGTEKRYGLIAVDFENDCKRIPKKSYYWYRDEINSDWEDVR